MSKYSNGYGSEWQLLRLMGRYRKYFDSLIIESIRNKDIGLNNYELKWFDFIYKDNSDAEWLGSDLFANLKMTGVHPNVLKSTNWDVLGEVDDYILLGEAKGRVTVEFEKKSDSSKAGERSINEYKTLIKEVLKYYSIDQNYLDNWINSAYQLGNRIAMNYYLSKNNFKSLILYILFIDDWKNYGDGRNSVDSKEEWDESFNRMLKRLGFISSRQMKLLDERLVKVYPNCENPMN